MPPAVSAALPPQPERAILIDSHRDLYFDVAGTRLRRGAGSIPLTLTEYHVLRTLAAVPGTTIKREKLLREASRDGHIGTLETLTPHIRRLRVKIEPEPSDPVLLATVRGIGYRLDPR